VRPTNKYHACVRRRRCKHKLPKIFVLSEKKPSLSGRKRDDSPILGTGHRLADSGNIVTRGPKPNDQIEITTLVCEKAHGCSGSRMMWLVQTQRAASREFDPHHAPPTLLDRFFVGYR
jgi:hypothetical protein